MLHSEHCNQRNHFDLIIFVITRLADVCLEQPKSPTVSCSPYPYVLENTNVTCTCRTTSLGQPAGYLRWIIANLTSEKIAVVQEEHTFVSKELQYTHHMTLSDHDRTWLRCDVIWGTSGSQGENYTARVGCKSFSLH